MTIHMPFAARRRQRRRLGRAGPRRGAVGAALRRSSSTPTQASPPGARLAALCRRTALRGPGRGHAARPPARRRAARPDRRAARRRDSAPPSVRIEAAGLAVARIDPLALQIAARRPAGAGRRARRRRRPAAAAAPAHHGRVALRQGRARRLRHARRTARREPHLAGARSRRGARSGAAPASLSWRLPAGMPCCPRCATSASSTTAVPAASPTSPPSRRPLGGERLLHLLISPAAARGRRPDRPRRASGAPRRPRHRAGAPAPGMARTSRARGRGRGCSTGSTASPRATRASPRSATRSPARAGYRAAPLRPAPVRDAGGPPLPDRGRRPARPPRRGPP